MCIFYFCSCEIGVSNPLALKLQCISESTGRLVQTQPPGPCPQSFSLVHLGWGLRTSLSESSWVIQMLLVQAPHFENHCSRGKGYIFCHIYLPSRDAQHMFTDGIALNIIIFAMLFFFFKQTKMYTHPCHHHDHRQTRESLICHPCIFLEVKCLLAAFAYILKKRFI